MIAPVGIIHYGMGNLASVANAFAALGAEARILTAPADLNSVDRIILPGVGAFGDGMKNLRSAGWIPALEEQVLQNNKPFLGLCLGMQLLATTGTEHGAWEGLGWIPGTVRRLAPGDPNIRVPHIGWNDTKITKTGGLYSDVKQPAVHYYVHSYVFEPADAAVISATCDHGEEFAASVELRNIFATQYHPEKSQKAGLAVLKNFLAKS
jgi:glutamine amidotransferase